VILLSSTMKKQFNKFALNPPQGLMLIGPHGSGKEQVLQSLASQFTAKPEDIIIIRPLEDKKQISINQAREIKKYLRLKAGRPQVILIPNAELLTREAQNSLLKIIEETPTNFHFFMATSSENEIIETIKSRVVLWHFKNPNSKEITSYFNHVEPTKLKRAIIISGNKPGELTRIVNNESTEEDFFGPIEYAKELLVQTTFERLLKVDSLSKNSPFALEVLDALTVICLATIENLANSNDLKKIKPWQVRLKKIEQARQLYDVSVQPKLILGQLFLVL